MQAFAESTHLSISAVAVDDVTNPAVQQIKMKLSKLTHSGEDSTHNNVQEGLAQISVRYQLCQTTSLNIRGISQGLLFRFQDSRTLSCQLFVETVRNGLRKARIGQNKYCGHNFRIGMAT